MDLLPPPNNQAISPAASTAAKKKPESVALGASSAIPDTAPSPGKGACQICGKEMLLRNMKRHFQGQHKEVYDKNLSIQEMVDKAAAEVDEAAYEPATSAAGPSTPAKRSAPAGPAPSNKKKKMTCPLCKCQTLKANMRRHVKHTHPGIWVEGETLQEMFNKATPFAADPMDLDGEDENKDEDEDEDEQVELALSEDEGEYGRNEEDEDDYDEGERAGQASHGGPGVEKLRRGWMSFGPV